MLAAGLRHVAPWITARRSRLVQLGFSLPHAHQQADRQDDKRRDACQAQTFAKNEQSQEGPSTRNGGEDGGSVSVPDCP